MTKINDEERKLKIERKILPGFIFSRINAWQKFRAQGFNFTNLGKIREIHENFSSPKFVPLKAIFHLVERSRTDQNI